MVLKFGGTSVGKFAENIAGIIKAGLDEGKRVAVVCSARSTNTKSEGTTNRYVNHTDKELKRISSIVGSGQ